MVSSREDHSRVLGQNKVTGVKEEVLSADLHGWHQRRHGVLCHWAGISIRTPKTDKLGSTFHPFRDSGLSRQEWSMKQGSINEELGFRNNTRPSYSNWVQSWGPSTHQVGKYDARVAQVPLAFVFNRLVSREQARWDLKQRPTGLLSGENLPAKSGILGINFPQWNLMCFCYLSPSQFSCFKMLA